MDLEEKKDMNEQKQHVNVFVGAETGLLKGINIEQKQWQNLNVQGQVNKDKEIKVMCWGQGDQSEIILGLRDRTVLTYDIHQQTMDKFSSLSGGKGAYVGLAKYQSGVLAAVESGLVMSASSPDEIQELLEASPDLCRMKQNPEEPHILATGGKENDLKIWDIKRPEEPVFKAKNVRHDWLELRVPVWVTDMAFIPGSQKIVTCTGHHQVRVYDPSGPQRRPVLDMTFDEYPLTSMSLVPGGNQVVVGNTHGRMALIDLRKGGYMVQCYKDFAGSIRCIECHPTMPLVASCGLDRFLRIHDLQSKHLLHKFYLKSRLNCLLLSKEWDTVSKEQEPSNTESTQQSKESSNEGLEMDEESDAIWDSMETVNTKTAKNDIPPKTGKETDIIETTAGFKRTKTKKTDSEIESRKKLKQTKEKRQDKAENRKHKKRKNRKSEDKSGKG